MPNDRSPATCNLALCRRHLTHSLLGLTLLAMLSSTWANPHFHAPYSGEEVDEYEVALPVSPDKEQTFLIPRDCPAAHYAFTHGAQQWCGRVERRVWDKVMQDCYYVTFLQQAGTQPVHDFVSNYDFRNADLRDLVAATDCGTTDDSPCEPLPLGVIRLRQILPRDEAGHADKEASADACRLRNGLFRGRVEFGEDGMRCHIDRQANGFRIVAIDYADVNADGYLDAVIRLIPLGRGIRHIPLILPLTRTQPDGPFSLPQNLISF